MSVETSMSVEESIRAMWRGVYDRDYEAIKPYLHDECIYTDMPVGPAVAAKGPDGIVARLKIALDTLSGYTGKPGVLVVDGENAFYEHAETWTWPTGETVTLPFVTVHRIKDGKIIRWKDYWDFNTILSVAPKDWYDGFASGGGDLSWMYDATGEL